MLLLALALALAAPALAGDGLGDQKATVDSKLSALQGKIAASQHKASALSTQIGALTGQIHSLEGRVGDVSSRLSALQSDLALRQRRLDKLNELFRLQTQRLRYLKHEYALSVQRLDLRLVAIYKQNDPTTIDLLLAAKSFDDVLDQLDYLGAIANQDKHVAAAVATAKREVKTAREKTKTVRAGVANEARAINASVQQAAILRGELLASQNKLAGARASKSHALVATKAADLCGGRRVAGARGRERQTRRANPGGAVRSEQRRHDRHVAVADHGADGRVHLAGQRADHEPLRHALGHAPSGHRHRRPHRHGDPRRRRRQGHLVRLDVRLRQPRDDRPRRRPRHALRPPVPDRHLVRRGGRAGRR